MVKISSEILRNKTNVPFKTRWTRLGLDNPIFFEPFTEVNKIISEFEKITKVTYTPWQIIDFKHFYQKFKKTDKNSKKWKSCLGWYVEYLVNGNYELLVDINQIKDEHLMIDKNEFYIHEFYPLIQPVKLNSTITSTGLAKKLNHWLLTPNIDAFARKISVDLKSSVWNHENSDLKSICVSIKSVQEFLLNFEQKLKKIEEISSQEVQQLSMDYLEQVKGWTKKK